MKVKKKKLSDFAGAWKDMGKKEADALIKEIYSERKVMSRRLQ